MKTCATLIPLTDERADPVLPVEMLAEPHRGSIVLTSGEHGTAWQRHFDDGKWHRSGGGAAKTWKQLLTMRQLTLVYPATERAS